MLMIIHTEIHSPEGRGEFPADTRGTRLGVPRGAFQLQWFHGVSVAVLCLTGSGVCWELGALQAVADGPCSEGLFIWILSGFTRWKDGVAF